MTNNGKSPEEIIASFEDGFLFRLFSRIQFTKNCWLWLGQKTGDGYGLIRRKDDKNKSYRVHRVIYEIFIDDIPKGLVLDHLCRTPSCVNPLHLEAVTCKENILRGIGPTANNKRKTHCAKGHKLEGKNLLKSATLGYRRCRTCINEIYRRYRKNKKEKALTDCKATLLSKADEIANKQNV